MIVDLRLDGEQVIVVGGGSEGLKKINSLLTQDCKIVLISNKTNKQIDKYVKSKKITFKKAALKDAGFLSKYRPYIVMAATDDMELNRRIVQKAKSMGCLAYASDDPDVSDFAHPSVINIEDTVQVAISTGGRSPAMARRLKIQAEKVFKKMVSSEDIAQIKLQKIARDKAKRRIGTQRQRRLFLYAVMNDETVKRFVKNDDLKGAQAQIGKMLREWDGE